MVIATVWEDICAHRFRHNNVCKGSHVYLAKFVANLQKEKKILEESEGNRFKGVGVRQCSCVSVNPSSYEKRTVNLERQDRTKQKKGRKNRNKLRICCPHDMWLCISNYNGGMNTR